MKSMVEIDKDGVEYIYLTANFEPADKESAVIVKVIYPNGRIEFGFVDNK